MNIINSPIIQNLGVAILNSLWQIGLIAFIYIFLLLIIKRNNFRLKYAAGVVCLVLVLFSFVYTNLSLNSQTDSAFPNSTETTGDIDPQSVQLKNWLEEEVIESNSIAANFRMKFLKIRMHLYPVAGVIGVVWLLGILFLLYRKLQAYKTLKNLKNNKYNVRSNKWEITLREISTKLNLKKHVDILFSPFVNSPLSFGFIKPVILFPLKITTGLSNEEIKCILMHELAHNLRNDYLINAFQNAIEVLFFYHPGTWWISKKIRTQREIICDEIVTGASISNEFYATTLLKLTELRISDANVAVAAKRNENEMLTRIKHILSKPDLNTKRKNSIFVIAAIAVIFIASGFTYHIRNNYLSSSDVKTKIENNLAPYQGSFALYDFNQNKYYAFNDSISNTRYPTFSTFKITSALIAFDIGIAKDESHTIKYDSLKYPLPDWMRTNNFFKNWYSDHTIKSALHYSVNWYFKELGSQIGNDKMVEYLNKLNYGNKNIVPGNDAFWFNGQLKISAREQAEFIKNILNLECTGITPNAQLLVKKAFPGERGSSYSLYGKTGTGELADNQYLGWFVGYLETRDNSYAFALNMFADDKDDIPGNKRQQMVKKIFTDLGIISN